MRYYDAAEQADDKASSEELESLLRKRDARRARIAAAREMHSSAWTIEDLEFGLWNLERLIENHPG